MKKSKLILILKQLSAREHNRFQKYVASPFFNKHQDVLALYDHLKGFAPDFEQSSLTKARVKAALETEDKRLDDKHFYNITSYLLELLCDFLAFLELEKNPLQQKKAMITSLRKRDLSNQIPATIRQHQTLQKRYLYKDSQLYWEQYQFLDEMDALFLEQASRDSDENLQLKSDALDRFYLSSKLQMACDMASRNSVIKANYTCYLIEDLKQHLQDYGHRYDDCPSIWVYYKLLKMLTEEDDNNYFVLKEGLEAEVQHFSREEAKLIYDYAENYCIRKINSGQRAYYQEFLDLYKAQLRTGTLLKEGYLDERDYKNMVTVGVRLKDYEWTETFIHTNKKLLKKEVRDNAFIYNLAAFYYAKGQYAKALRSLHEVEFTDDTYHLGAKDIQLKSYYELDESEAFEALINAFRIYIRRNKKLSEYRKEVYLNYLKLAKKIEALREKKGFIAKTKFEKERQAIALELKEAKALANSDWLQMVFENL